MPIDGIAENIGSLVEEAAGFYGNRKNAICFEREELSFSFSDLNIRVNQYANALRSIGVEKGAHVAVMLPNCPAFPLTWLALAKLGAIMVPINIRYQTHDLSYVLNDSDATVMVVHTEAISTFREVMTRCPKIKSVAWIGEGSPDLGQNLEEMANSASKEFQQLEKVGPDDLINIQYTSGTTGFPKGCLLTHEYWLTTAKMNAARLTEDDVFLSAQPFYYMDPQWHLIMTLTAGCTVVLANRYRPSKYMELVRKYGVTASLAVRAILIYKQPPSPLDSQNKLRFLLIYGFPPHLHKKFEERFNVVAREGFGMTEIGSCMRAPLEDPNIVGTGTVGVPLPHRRVRIVDEQGQDVPDEEVGELWISGPGMFKSYYKKPEETARVFDGTWFRTGDLFKRDARGYYYIVGRKKDMVRRHSENISAIEVEDVIKTHPKIADAAVLPVADEDAGEEVKVYVIPDSGESRETIPPEAIIEFCAQHLAKFKIPRYIEYREEFPRTPTLKVIKHILLNEKIDLRSGSYDALQAKWHD